MRVHMLKKDKREKIQNQKEIKTKHSFSYLVSTLTKKRVIYLKNTDFFFTLLTTQNTPIDQYQIKTRLITYT